jgi:hypothetical protein
MNACRTAKRILPKVAFPLLLAAPVVLQPGAASASAVSGAVWNRLASCESSSHWHTNTGNGYYGGLQFASGTWRSFGGRAYASRADLATKHEQIAIAERVLDSQGPDAWPGCAYRAGLR